MCTFICYAFCVVSMATCAFTSDIVSMFSTITMFSVPVIVDILIALDGLLVGDVVVAIGSSPAGPFRKSHLADLFGT